MATVRKCWFRFSQEKSEAQRRSIGYKCFRSQRQGWGWGGNLTAKSLRKAVSGSPRRKPWETENWARDRLRFHRQSSFLCFPAVSCVLSSLEVGDQSEWSFSLVLVVARGQRKVKMCFLLTNKENGNGG